MLSFFQRTPLHSINSHCFHYPCLFHSFTQGSILTCCTNPFHQPDGIPLDLFMNFGVATDKMTWITGNVLQKSYNIISQMLLTYGAHTSHEPECMDGWMDVWMNEWYAHVLCPAHNTWPQCGNWKNNSQPLMLHPLKSWVHLVLLLWIHALQWLPSTTFNNTIHYCARQSIKSPVYNFQQKSIPSRWI